MLLHVSQMNLCFFPRISQDLAKDLAMLAREIHDVAGEIDSVSPAATDPAARVNPCPTFPVCRQTFQPELLCLLKKTWLFY